jgi:hypothetical protein
MVYINPFYEVTLIDAFGYENKFLLFEYTILYTNVQFVDTQIGQIL